MGRTVKQYELRGWLATVDVAPGGTPSIFGGQIALTYKGKFKGESGLAKFDPSKGGDQMAIANFISNGPFESPVLLPPSSHRLVGLVEEDMKFDPDNTSFSEINKYFDPGKMGGVFYFPKGLRGKISLITPSGTIQLSGYPRDLLRNIEIRYKTTSTPFLSDSQEIINEIKSEHETKGIKCYTMQRLDQIA